MISLDWTREGWRVYEDQLDGSMKVVAVLDRDLQLPSGACAVLKRNSARSISHGWIKFDCALDEFLAMNGVESAV